MLLLSHSCGSCNKFRVRMIVIKRQKYEIRRGMEVDVLEAMFAYERSLIGSTILDLIS